MLEELSPRLHCRHLDRIFREWPVLEHAGREPVGRFQQRPQQRGERRFVTALRVPNQVRVGGVLHAVVLYTLGRTRFVTWDVTSQALGKGHSQWRTLIEHR